MDGIEIRPPREEEYAAAIGVVATAFGDIPSAEDKAFYREVFPRERALATFENGKLVASSAVIPMELTLPGGSVLPAAGLTWVGVLPTHRRRGLMRRLMLGQWTEMKERREPLSVLLASEGSIYSRFGYGPCTSLLSFHVERAHAALAVPIEDPGVITLLDPDEAEREIPLIYDGLRLKQPGALSRTAAMWKHHFSDPLGHRQGGGGMFHVKHETTPGVAGGYASYRIREEYEAALPSSRALVVEVQAPDPAVYRALWRYLLSLDLYHTISFADGRVDEPLRWLLADPRRFRVDGLADHLWLALLDVPRALAARAYGAEDRLVLEVTHPFPEPRAERYLLSSGPVGACEAGAHEAECVRTRAQPDLVLDVGVLGSTYLGGTSFAALATAGRLLEQREGAIVRADAMFRTGVAPYCVTDF